MICIKLEVKAHKHAQHTEQVLVLEGTGNMQLGDKIIGIKKGDLIAIPKNTWHGVKNTSPDGKPLKVISFQSPLFDGKDRIMKPEN